MAINPLQLASIASEIAQDLGLDNWSISPASYNGVAFQVFTSLPQSLNPLRGTTVQGYNANPQTAPLPLFTNAGVYNVQDRARRRLVIHDIPNRDGTFMEDQGWEGETYTMMSILFGINYQPVLSNIRNYFTNDASVSNPTANLNVLVHPIYGTIRNVKLSEMTSLHSYDKWRAVVLRLTFIADNQIGTFPVADSSLASQIFQYSTAIYSLLTEIGAAIQLSTVLYNRIGTIFDSPTMLTSKVDTESTGETNNPVLRSDILALNTANQALQQLFSSSIKLLYQYLKPLGYNDPYLNGLTINYDLLPTLLRYATLLTQDEVNSLVSYYADQTASLIQQYADVGISTVFYKKLLIFNNAVATLSGFGKTLLNAQDNLIYTYTTPYDMSLRRALFLNGFAIPQMDMTDILLLNRDAIGSVNFIPKGTALTLKRYFIGA